MARGPSHPEFQRGLKGFYEHLGEKIDDAKRENAKSKHQDISMCFAPVSAVNSVRLC